jgi:hypothetical protein
MKAQKMTTTQPTTRTPRTLQTFALDDLAQFTAEGEFGPNASQDYRVLYVGRDDVHEALKHIFGRVTLSVKMNMFGFDDDELNDIIMGLVENPNVLVQVSLDKSQAAGAHEKTILARDKAQDLAQFATHFAIGDTDTGQILHTKGGVLDNIVAFEGSTNWSNSGEGTHISLDGRPKVPGFKAQANTLTIHTNPYEVAKFAATLDHWFSGRRFPAAAEPSHCSSSVLIAIRPRSVDKVRMGLLSVRGLSV